MKHFADDTYLFTVAKDKNESANIINNDLFLISKWACNWKIISNPDPENQPKRFYFQEKQSGNSSNHKFEQCTGWKNVLSKIS